MLTRRQLIYKWLLYTAAAVVCLFVQSAILQRITIWGVLPFLYPLVAIMPATYEGPSSGAIFALCAGVFCDVLLPDQFPCLYTLTFPLAGLYAGSLSRSFLPPGVLCSFVSMTGTFLITDLFRCFLLWINEKAAWSAGLFVMLREFLVTAPLVIPVTLLFHAVYRKIHEND